MKSNRSHDVDVPERPGRTARVLRRLTQGAMLLALASMTTGLALAQVPPRVEAQLLKIGRIVDPPCTALIYRPMMPKHDIANDRSEHLYPGMRVIRNQSFGPNPDDVVDIFSGNRGAASRTVLIFVPGGIGNKTEIQNKAANAFYDNIGRWAVQHGMVGVLMQRHSSRTWNGGAKDISSMIQWLEAHIGQYHGNPNRMFIWAHSAGNNPLGTYAGRPELWGPHGVGVKGIIFMSPAPFDIAPVQVPRPRNFNAAAARNILSGSGKACGLPAGAAFASAGALPGVPPGHPGGPPLNPPRFGPPAAGARGGRRAAGPGFGPAVSPAVELARSSLPALEKSSARIMVAYAQLDPPGMGSFVHALHAALCKAGRCPMMVMNKGESHMSEMFSVDTSDHTVSNAVMRFIRSTP